MSTDPLEQAVNSAVQRTELFAASDREDDALALLDETLQRAPDHPTLLANRAWILNRLGRHAEALAAANAALASAPEMIQAHYQRCHALFGLGNGSAAEDAALRGLELDPENVDFHLFYAQLLGSKQGRGRERKRRRALAFSHIDTALSLAPEDPLVLSRAASSAWGLGNTDLAEHYVAQGLALAPENVGLLELRASLVTATTQPTGKYDSVTQPAVAMAEANKLLQADPQHQGARRTLFAGLWFEQVLLVDGPLAPIAVAALGYAASFRSNGEVWSPILGVLFVLLFAAVRFIAYYRITSKASSGFRRMLTHETRFASLRHGLSIGAWVLTLLAASCALFVRDAIAVRWMLVVLAVAAFLALAASTLLHLSYPAAVRRAGGFQGDADSLVRLASYRSELRGRVWLRVFALLGTVAMSYFGVSGRSDAVPIAFLAVSALILSSLIALILARRTELRLGAEVPEGTVLLPETYRRPRLVSAVPTAVVVLLALAILIVNAANIPVLPNTNDDIGTYSAAPAAENPRAVDSRETCSGRPATRLACILERAKERQNTELPEIEAPKLDLDVTVSDDYLENDTAR